MEENAFTVVPICIKPGTTQLRVAHVADRDILASVLRNRTVLAYLHQNGLLKANSMSEEWNLWAPSTMTHDEKWDWFDRFFEQPGLTISDAGALLALRDTVASFNMQSPVLLMKKIYDPGDMRHAFDASLRWLGDHPGVKRTLESTWPTLVNS